MTPNPTRAAIMAADLPTLRLWCAEYVMGWVWFEYEGGTRYFRTPDNFTYGAIDVPGHEMLFFDVLPDYPADIAAAWTVHKKMIDNPRYANELFKIVKDRVGPPKGALSWILDIEPQDICRAALLAVAEKDR